MRTFDPKKVKIRDEVAIRRRRRFFMRAGFLALGALAILAAIGYGLFFTPWFAISRVDIDNLDAEHAVAVKSVIDENLNHKFLGIPVGKNILFFDDEGLSASLVNQFSFLNDLSIKKDYFNALAVRGTERNPEGVWCFASGCRYFDHEGILWGSAIRSSGYLLLNIDDFREENEEKIDKEFLTAIQTVSARFKEKNIRIKKITIPENSFTDFEALIDQGYPIKFSVNSPINEQLDILLIFKKNKVDSGDLKPQYLDVRYDGRVYYK